MLFKDKGKGENLMKLLDFFEELASPENEFIKRWKARNKLILGYTCSYTPEEIIYAGNILPVRVLGSFESVKLADAYVPINVCSFAKSCFDKALSGEYDFLDGYVVSNTCDNYNKMYDLWRYYTKIPKMYFINTPHSNTEKSLEFFHEELERFKNWLESNFKTTISEESLKEAVKMFNENRLLLRKVYELRKKEPPLISGAESLEVVLSSMMTPKEEHNKLLHQLLDEIEGRNDLPKEGARLLVSSSVMSDSKLLRLIENVGGNVVADDLCTGSRYFWNLVEEGKEPLNAIAKRYLGGVPCPFMYSYEERFRHVREMAKLFDVEGVIVFLLKFCDVHSFDAPLLAEELKEKEGLPVLCLEWEYSLSGIAQLRTRIEAFIEMIRGVS